MISGMVAKRLHAESKNQYNKSILQQSWKTTDGQQIVLAEVGSKYLFLDFWTSWCLPCRYENRKIENSRHEIDVTGLLTIVGVSLDANETKWLHAYKADQLSYISIVDTREFNSPFAKAFGIEKIPHNVIIDKEGKIIARNLWDRELIDFVKKRH